MVVMLEKLLEVPDDQIALFIVDKAMEMNFENISRLQVVKILYLLDKKFKEKTGKRLTGYDYVKNKLGPLDKKIINDLETLLDKGILQNSNSYYSYIRIELPTDFVDTKKKIDGIIDQEGLREILTETLELARDVNDILNVVENFDEVKNAKMGTPIVV